MKARALLVIVAVAALTFGGRFVLEQHAAANAVTATYSTVDAATLTGAGLPTEEMAKTVLSAALMHRHPQYLDIPAGSTAVRSFVVFPQRADNSPVLVITSNNQGMSDWLRAVGDDAAGQGFIAVVPDLLTGLGPNGGGTHEFTSPDAVFNALENSRDEVLSRTSAVAESAIKMPASNGNGASVKFNFANGQGRIDVAIESPVRLERSFELREHAWHNALAFLSGQINSFAAAPQAAARPQATRVEGADDRANMREKRPDLPANFLMAAKTVAQSPRKGEWIDIPMASGTKLHTWISYPQTTNRAPVVLVFQPGPGMDMGEPPTRGGGANWLRAVADQLAAEGFIAVLPDLSSGLGPNGGNFDSFRFPDEAGAAMSRINDDEVRNRIRAARDYALKLPMANGRLGSTGFCAGGGRAWEAAALIEGMNASVVFYGGPPPENVMSQIKAPVAAFFGTNDLGLAPRIGPATADMKRLGKEFEVNVYEEATHVFLYRQDLGRNWAATRDAWPKAIAFFKKHLMTPAGSQ
jgi:carboxymethylenebutenolidase